MGQGAVFAGSLTLPGGGLPKWAEVRVDAAGLAVVDREGQRYDISYDDLEVDSGGFEGDVIFCRSRRSGISVSVSDKGFLAALREVAPALAPQVESAGKQISNRKRMKTAGLVITALVVVLLGVLVYKAPAMLAASVESLPMSIDRELGDSAFADMQSQLGPSVSSPAVVGFVQEVVNRLAPMAAVEGVAFRVHVVRDDTVNAFALPGGQIVVFTGLLEKARSPDEVAGVLAHEMAHVTLRHGLRNAAHKAGTRLALLLLIGDEGWGALAGEVAAFAQQNAYSRDQESDADAEGVRMLRRAGLDAEGLASFFDLLKGEMGSELTGFANWFSTHPEHDERIRHVRQVASEIAPAPPRPLEVDWAAVKSQL